MPKKALFAAHVIAHSTTPMPSSHAAIVYWIVSRPVTGRVKKKQASAPITGSTVGVTKCLRSIGSRRSTSTAMLTTVNTASSSRAVVPPRAGTTSLSLVLTKEMSPKAMVVVNTIATHGVRRPRCTHPSTGGRTSWRDMP